MSDGKPRGNPATVVRLMAVAITSSPLLYAAVGSWTVLSGAMQPSPLDLPPETVGVAEVAVGLSGAFGVIASFFVRRLLESRSSEPVTLSERLRTMLVSMAVAESASIIGLVFAFLTGRLVTLFVLCGLSVVGCLFHFPKSDWFNEPRNP